MVTGLLLVQAAWIVLIPPFDGAGEHDHAFKAAAVARGDWGGDHERVALGRGGRMAVPLDVVEAARPACVALPYTKRDDCHPIAPAGDGMVIVGSSFAPTHPAFYGFIGAAALPFDGAAAGYAMRAAGALLCAALIVTAAAVIRRTATSYWPGAAFVLVLTPAMIYATSLPAPNGPEMAAGLLLWSALLFGSTATQPAPPWVIAAGTLGAVLLATVRTIGPLWLVMIVVVAVMYRGVPWAAARVRDRAMWPAYLVTVTAMAAGAAWTLAFSPNDPANDAGARVTADPWSRIPAAWLVWTLQQVAAMPRRDDMVPALAYAVVVAAWVLLLLVVLRHGHPAARQPIAAVFLLTTAVSVVLTALTYREIGLAWQGRYSWPFVLGWLLVAAHALERRRVEGHRIALGAAGVAALVSLTVSLVGTRDTLERITATAQRAWSAPSLLLLVVMTVAGALLIVAAASRMHTASAATKPLALETGRRALIG